MQARFAHEFPCDPERFWSTYFSDEYNQGLDERLRLRRTVLEKVEDDAGIRRLIRFELTAQRLPTLVKKVAGDRISYEERSTWRRADGTINLDIDPGVPALRGKFHMTAVMRVVPARPGSVRREIDATITVRIPLLGGQLERLVADELRKSYDIAAEFTRRWLTDHP